MAQEHIDRDNRIYIKANRITIGRSVTFGKSIDVRLKGDFSIGDRSHLGDDVEVRGNNVSIGCDLFHSRGLRVGGGGRLHPRANLSIGDRCTIHDNFINVCEEVRLGNDVGLSPKVAILTHGYWLSVLDGFPARFAPVTVHDGAIVGYRALVMMGTTIGVRTVVGAQSVVTRDLEPDSIYAGNPAKLIRRIVTPSQEEKLALFEHIVTEYKSVASYHGLSPDIETSYPFIRVNGCRFNAVTLVFDGTEDAETDDFRDYVRKWGLRFYSERPFKSVWQ
ncbi:MAG: acyltransferase [candidate division WOR-3 bacterium]|nr:acyltransferase [candidate division WOR-3 bacterium]